MQKMSAGILLYRISDGRLQVFLSHPGGPLWAGKEQGSWSIPKGLIGPQEEPLDAARREFREETGHDVDGHFVPLSPVRSKSGKVILAWALQADCDAESIRSNTFSMEWPPRSGRRQEFPEIDRAAWFGIREAVEMINEAQAPLLEELRQRVTSKDTGITP